MNRHVMVVLAAAVFALLVSSTPAAAQNRGNGVGQGPQAVAFCNALLEGGICSNADALGLCISDGNIFINSFKTGSAQLFGLCCEECFAALAACGVESTICTDLWGCTP